jgi:catechol 2,3-dioxygenase-like lactoylglutathione lyase family enzyme
METAMSITGIDRITYGVEDVAKCRQFFLDWGLDLAREDGGRLVFETLNGCEVVVAPKDDPSLPPAIEPGSTLREVVWCVPDASALAAATRRLEGAPGYAAGADGSIGATDPNGLAVRVRVSRKRPIDVQGIPINTWDRALRVDTPSAVYDRARPVEVGHVVFFTDRLDAAEAFYRERLGFVVSDRYPGRGVFLRTSVEGGHHDLFLLQPPQPKRGVNHVAFTVRDIPEVFGGGLHISRCGWETEIGPGRHPVSSAYFWYVKNPAGGLAEYYSDEDVVTAKWQPREFQPAPEVFAEWAVIGGIDGNTRRQKQRHN